MRDFREQFNWHIESNAVPWLSYSLTCAQRESNQLINQENCMCLHALSTPDEVHKTLGYHFLTTQPQLHFATHRDHSKPPNATPRENRQVFIYRARHKTSHMCVGVAQLNLPDAPQRVPSKMSQAPTAAKEGMRTWP
jgi:hypothetical protein